MSFMALPVVLSFLGVVLALMSLYSLWADYWLRDEARISERIQNEFVQQQREHIRRSTLFRNLSQYANQIEATQDAKPTLEQRLELAVDQAALPLALRTLCWMALAAATVLGLAAALVCRDLVIAVMAGFVGIAVPVLYVFRCRKARLEKLQSQLPDAFDLMSRILRSGQTLSQAFNVIALECEQPIAAEFGYCSEQQNLGLSPETAYRDLARRTGLLEIKIFTMSVLVQQESGGNLAELLDKLAAVLRERFRVRSRVWSLTAEGRMQALLLIALPPLLLVVLLLLRPEYVRELLEQPSLITATILCQAAGAYWIHRIINAPV